MIPAPQPQEETEQFSTQLKTHDGQVCYPDCIKFETKRCPYPGFSVMRDTCPFFRSASDDRYIQSIVFVVYNYPKEIERIVKEHDAAIAAQAREDVLDDLTIKLIDLIIIDGTAEFVKFPRRAISSVINSLRTKEKP